MQETPGTDAVADDTTSWMPMVVIGMTQILMVFNVSTLQVSIEGIVSSFSTPATTVGTAIVAYSLVVAGFIMLGARLAARLGSRRVFRSMVLLFGAAMGIMSISPNATIMIVAQLIAGAAAAALVPTLVVLIADNYRGEQKAKALGWLGGTQAMGIVLAFLIAGSLATWIGWRFTFGLLVVLAIVIWRLSARLSPIARHPGVAIDYVGVLLAATAITLISVGANNLTHWGLLLAAPGAPFSLLDMSPAPFMIVAGVFLLEAFLEWSIRRRHRGGTTLVALEVIDTPKERSALFSMFAIGAIGSALTFLIPLYVQIVQGATSFAAALALLPFSLASFLSAVFVIRVHGRLSPRQIARYAFLLMACALAFLGAVIRNDWSSAFVTASMFAAGVAEGALVTMLFNVLVMASPRELAGDVGSLRGTTNNLAAGVGTALASTLVVAVLGSSVHRELVHNQRIPADLKMQANLDSVSFTSDEHLRRTLERTSATAAQIREAEEINGESRLLALKVTFFALSGLALLAYFPAGRLPGSAPRGAPATPA
jgi:predicted MFS family arabinose efflux permease